MKANELRIGNYIWLESKQKEYQISSGHDIEEIDDAPLNFDAQPIPLTREWLLKFGFEKNNQSYQVVYTINVEDEYEQDYTSKLYLGLDGQYFIGIPYELFRGKSKIQYVHQLQNLYFALTGEELTIKEEK